MNPIWVPRNEHYYSKGEVLKIAQARGYTITGRTLNYWIEIGLLPGPDKKGLAGGRSEGRWSQRAVALMLGLLFQQRHGNSTAFLCNVPVWGWIYWGEASGVTLEQLRRAMSTWARWVHRARFSQEKTRSAVNDLLGRGASEHAVYRRRIKRALAEVLTQETTPDARQLYEIVQPMIDPDRKGEAKGPPELRFSAGLIASGLEARLWAIKLLLDQERLKKIPESLWEWARTNVAVSDYSYQQRQPKLAENQDLGPDFFRQHDWMESVTGACMTLATVLGAGVRALETNTPLPALPPSLQPQLWVEGKMQATVRSRNIISSLMLPNGGHPCYQEVEVVITNKETGEMTRVR
jgi:hypothetical protein